MSIVSGILICPNCHEQGMSDYEYYECKEIYGQKKVTYKVKYKNEQEISREEISSEIIKEMDSFGRKNGLKGFEIPKQIFLFKDKFSVENQIITPTMKMKRHVAKKFFEKEINKMYEN